ncbi:MAG TPA: 50S ribosomal protein L28 [Firmicutes bacterium]|nr:50S ribosomal protein L28 [Bacillota bacterium]
MAYRCDICGKNRMSGNNVSHAENKTHRTWKPNLHQIKALIDGSPKRIKVCTRCLRSGKVTRTV